VVDVSLESALRIQARSCSGSRAAHRCLLSVMDRLQREGDPRPPFFTGACAARCGRQKQRTRAERNGREQP